jgi:DHA1 family tetracycline resistance protein-like MFS transporter
MYRFGFDAQHNGYLFAFIGIIAVFIQGLLIGRLVKRFGELFLVVSGALILMIGLLMIPYVGPQAGGLFALLFVCGIFSIGNSLSTPALTSLASKSVGASERGGVLGITQSAASLARVVGPVIGAFLIYSASAPRHMDDHSIFKTFWAAAGIMFAAFLLALYFARAHAAEYAKTNFQEQMADAG